MNNPIIDWELTIQLAGNNNNYAEEYLNLLANDLSKHLKIIHRHFAQQNFDEIKKNIHYILGGLSYCGATRLKSAASDLNNKLNNNMDIADALRNFETEANLFIEYVSIHPCQ